MLRSAVAVGEQTGRLDHDVDVEVAPGQLLGVALRQKLDLVFADGDRAVADLDILVEPAEHGVVLEQVRHRLRVPEIVGRDDLKVAFPFQMSPEEIPSNPPEAVDAHFGRHFPPRQFHSSVSISTSTALKPKQT